MDYAFKKMSPRSNGHFYKNFCKLLLSLRLPMTTPSSIKQDKHYMSFVSSLPEAQVLTDEIRALKKEVQKKRRRLNTILSKYYFTEEIVAVNNTGVPLSLSIKKALKKIGFPLVHHVDKGGREDIFIEYNGKILIMEITGVAGGVEVKKVRQIIVDTLVAKGIHAGKELHGCLVINHNRRQHHAERKNNAFRDRFAGAEISAAGISVMTTITLREMLIAVIRKELSLDEFFQRLWIVGEVKYTPD